ncbi:MAG: hypothetical protein WCP53_13480 [Verrucomicrobiota bacterium]
MNLERLTYLTRLIGEYNEERTTIARAIAPVAFETLCPDRCNISDRVFEADVRRFMADHMKEIDTTLLDREDSEKWENLAPRYEVRSLTRGEGEDEEEGYGVFDHDEDAFVDNEGPAFYFDESDADELCAEKNEEDAENSYGFPFAWNTGRVMEGTYWLAELRASGFKVYRYDEDAIVAGIDGAGYSFMGAHFAPFYARLAARNDWLVQTVDGPRRISFGGEPKENDDTK